MAKCKNCGGHVSDSYLRVFAPEKLEGTGRVRACPYCTKVRQGNDVRTARARGAAYQEGEIE